MELEHVIGMGIRSPLDIFNHDQHLDLQEIIDWFYCSKDNQLNMAGISNWVEQSKTLVYTSHINRRDFLHR